MQLIKYLRWLRGGLKSSKLRVKSGVSVKIRMRVITTTANLYFSNSFSLTSKRFWILSEKWNEIKWNLRTGCDGKVERKSPTFHLGE